MLDGVLGGLPPVRQFDICGQEHHGRDTFHCTSHDVFANELSGQCTMNAVLQTSAAIEVCHLRSQRCSSSKQNRRSSQHHKFRAET
jgi:hypothetical protein